MLPGRSLDLLDPRRSTSRSRTPPMAVHARRAGTARPRAQYTFSVAQHTLLVDTFVARTRWPSLDRGARPAVLLHDAPEYVIGDMISPFKAVIGGAYKSGRGAAPRRHPSAIWPAASSTATRSCAIIKRRPRRGLSWKPRGWPSFSAAEARRRFSGARGAALARDRAGLSGRPGRRIPQNSAA